MKFKAINVHIIISQEGSPLQLAKGIKEITEGMRLFTNNEEINNSKVKWMLGR